MSHDRSLARWIWSEPKVPNPPRVGLLDWVLLGALVAPLVFEAAWRADLHFASVPVIVGIVLLPTILGRRSRPLWMVAIAFGGTAFLDLLRLTVSDDLPKLHSVAYLLLLPYALFRWASGREIVVGLLIMLVSAGLGFRSDHLPIGDVLGGTAVLLAPMALGTTFRLRARAQSRELAEAKLLERERLARDLHDTVAHHVSAIAVRAQAGLAMSSESSDPAIEALRIIEAEASRTLVEMRAMVRFLRRDEAPALAPQPVVADLQDLVHSAADGLDVDLQVSGNLDDLPAPVSTAVYRIVQESITNARRHSRHATRIVVVIEFDETSVQLRVSDDGERVPAGKPAPPGYGLVGMRERAEQLGGTLEAGPNDEHRWTVTARIPRKGLAS